MRQQLNETDARQAIAVKSEFDRHFITSWDFGDLPESVEVRRHGMTLRGYPALVDNGASVSLRLLDTPEAAVLVETKSGADARAYVRFNLPAIPAGCQVTNARLRLYASSYKTGRTLQAWRVAAPWTEGGLNWSNQPQTAGTVVTTTSGSGYREWVVTQMVRDMYAPNANNGFTIRDAVANGQLPQDFHSREKGTDNPPRLVLTFGP